LLLGSMVAVDPLSLDEHPAQTNKQQRAKLLNDPHLPLRMNTPPGFDGRRLPRHTSARPVPVRSGAREEEMIRDSKVRLPL
jgi:hypothetical protein